MDTLARSEVPAWFENLEDRKIINAAVFNTLRILKGINPDDNYLDNYLHHFGLKGDKFFDYYHILWWMGANRPPKRIMEIGCRTGISLCQLMSAMMSYDGVEIHLFDVFEDCKNYGYLSPGIVKMNLRALNVPTDNVHFHIGDSTKLVPQFKKENPSLKFDYVLVDGDHDKKVAWRDLENVVDLVETGGFLFFDDISEDGCNLDHVWQKFKNRYTNFEYHENYDGKGIGWAIKQ